MDAHITGRTLKDIERGSKITLEGKNYRLLFDLNALCELEDKYGSLEDAMKKLSELGEKDKSGKPRKMMKDVRFLLWQALRHEDDNIAETDAAKLITIQNLQQAVNAIGYAMQSAVPEADEKNAESPQER